MCASFEGMALAETTDVSEAMEILAKVDFGAVEPGERRRCLAMIGTIDAQWAAAKASLLGEYDTKKDWAAVGHRSPAVGLCKTAKVPMPAARQAVALGRALRKMPETQAALASGSITTAHAMRLRPTSRRPQFASGGERLLVEQAALLSWRDWLTAVDTWESYADDENNPDADGDPREAKAFFNASPVLDGMGRLDGLLGPVGFEAFEEALHRIENDLFNDDWAEAVERVGKDATPDDLARTPAQRRAAAVVEMAHRAMTAPADGKRPLPLIVIHSDPDTFNHELARVVGIEAPAPLGTARMCELDSGVAIRPSEMIRQALHGTVRRLVYTSKSHVLDYGTEVRLFRGALRQAIIHAARTCREPDCDIRASRCEIDHRIPAAAGGPTSAANGQPLCPGGHRHKSRTDPG